MTVRTVPWKLFLRRAALGAAFLILLAPMVILSAFFAIGTFVEEELL